MADLQSSNVDGNISNAIDIADAPVVDSNQHNWSKIWSFPGKEIWCSRLDIPMFDSTPRFNIAIEGSAHVNEGFYGEITFMSDRNNAGTRTGPATRLDRIAGYFETDFGGNYNLSNVAKAQSSGSEIRFITAFNHDDPSALSTSGRNIQYQWFVLVYELNQRNKINRHWVTLMLNWSRGGDTGEVRTYFS